MIGSIIIGVTVGVIFANFLINLVSRNSREFKQTYDPYLRDYTRYPKFPRLEIVRNELLLKELQDEFDKSVKKVQSLVESKHKGDICTQAEYKLFKSHFEIIQRQEYREKYINFMIEDNLKVIRGNKSIDDTEDDMDVMDWDKKHEATKMLINFLKNHEWIPEKHSS